VLEVDGNAALPAVEAEKVRGLAAQEWWSPGTSHVSGAGVFDLDDGGPVAGHQHGAVGAGQRMAEVENGEAGKGRRHERSPETVRPRSGLARQSTAREVNTGTREVTQPSRLALAIILYWTGQLQMKTYGGQTMW